MYSSVSHYIATNSIILSVSHADPGQSVTVGSDYPESRELLWASASTPLVSISRMFQAKNHKTTYQIRGPPHRHCKCHDYSTLDSHTTYVCPLTCVYIHDVSPAEPILPDERLAIHDQRYQPTMHESPIYTYYVSTAKTSPPTCLE